MPDKKMKFHLASRFLNTPLLLTRTMAETILAMIKSGIDVGSAPPIPEARVQQTFSKQTLASSDDVVAVIPIHGIINQHADDWMEYYYDETSYETIRRQFNEALQDTTVKAIVFDVDTNGGVVAGCFDLVDEIYSARTLKPIYAVLNNTAYSAGYALASAAEKIYIPRDGGAGSVGVISVHIDQSGMDEQYGIKFTSIYAGDRKDDFNPHSPLSDEARAIIQDAVNGTYDVFAKTVARNRGMTVQAVKATEAALYFGQKAVDIGFADALMPSSKALNEILKKNSSGKGGNMKALVDRIKAFFTEEKASPEVINQAMGEIGFIPKPEAAAPPDLEKLKADIRTESAASAATIMEICVLGGCEKMAAGFIREGITEQQAREKVLAEKARLSGDKNISSTVSATTTGDVNPLLEDAKQRAEKAAPKQK